MNNEMAEYKKEVVYYQAVADEDGETSPPEDSVSDALAWLSGNPGTVWMVTKRMVAKRTAQGDNYCSDG